MYHGRRHQGSGNRHRDGHFYNRKTPNDHGYYQRNKKPKFERDYSYYGPQEEQSNRSASMFMNSSALTVKAVPVQKEETITKGVIKREKERKLFPVTSIVPSSIEVEPNLEGNMVFKKEEDVVHVKELVQEGVVSENVEVVFFSVTLKNVNKTTQALAYLNKTFTVTDLKETDTVSDFLDRAKQFDDQFTFGRDHCKVFPSNRKVIPRPRWNRCMSPPRLEFSNEDEFFFNIKYNDQRTLGEVGIGPENNEFRYHLQYSHYERKNPKHWIPYDAVKDLLIKECPLR
jgi:hypothetical protein